MLLGGELGPFVLEADATFILRNRLSGGLVAGEGAAPAAEFGRLAVTGGRR
jgi:hypothetical protein